MSVYENGRNFFLLQTENFEPLLGLIDLLNNKILENQKIIDEVTTSIDGKFEYPDLPIAGEDEENDGEEVISVTLEQQNLNNSVGQKESSPAPDLGGADMLSNFLVDKYKLNEIRISKDINHANPRAKSLLEDIERLKILRLTNSKKNRQLYQVIQDYELFIVTDVLPKLRKDIEKCRNEAIVDIKTRQINLKFESEGKVWSNYVQYIEHLEKLIKASELLSRESDEMNTEEVLIMEQKLIILQHIKNHLTKS